MPIGNQTTLTAVTAPTVLTIGCPPELEARCARALEAIGAILKECELSCAATVVAERQPLVIVLEEDLYAFDPEEFDALARDVRASLLRVEEDITEAKLELLLSAAIDAALARRREQGAVIPSPAKRRPSLVPGALGPISGRAGARRKRSPSSADLEAPPSSPSAGRS